MLQKTTFPDVNIENLGEFTAQVDVSCEKYTVTVGDEVYQINTDFAVDQVLVGG